MRYSLRSSDWGTVSLAAGMLDTLLPVFPTTLYLVLAVAAFARGSDRLYGCGCSETGFFGRYIRDRRTYRSIPFRMKVVIAAMIVVAVALSSHFGVPSTPLRAALVGLGVVGLGYGMFMLPTRRRET